MLYFFESFGAWVMGIMLGGCWPPGCTTSRNVDFTSAHSCLTRFCLGVHRPMRTSSLYFVCLACGYMGAGPWTARQTAPRGVRLHCRHQPGGSTARTPHPHPTAEADKRRPSAAGRLSDRMFRESKPLKLKVSLKQSFEFNCFEPFMI